MQDEKVRKFIALAGQSIGSSFITGSPEQRKLGAHLLLSEVLEYVIHGLGVTPEIKGTAVTDPEAVTYTVTNEPDRVAMLDGLADVGYTMNWNAVTFGVPLEEGYDLVCDNNLEKFVALGPWAEGLTELPRSDWGCRASVSWPADVANVFVVPYKGQFFAVGKDQRGKVRKPSTYRSVELGQLVT